MKRLWMALALSMLIVSLFGCGNFQTTNNGSGKGYTTIASGQLVSLLNDKKDVQIIDLRELALYNKGHIPGAINIPFNEFKNRMNEVSKNKPVVFVCHTGPMGDVASQMMVDHGVTKVSNLKGGMGGWDGPISNRP